jgi:superfamily I DNA and RNA helicase
MIYDENLNNIAEIENLVIHPISARKLFVTEKESELVSKLVNKNSRDKVSSENVKYEIVNDISQVNPELEFDEIIFVINDASTNLKWYKKQRGLAKNYISRIKLVHVISQSK